MIPNGLPRFMARRVSTVRMLHQQPKRRKPQWPWSQNMNTKLVMCMLAGIVILAMPGATAEPEHSSPTAHCETMHLPGGAWVEQCDGSYLIGFPDGG